MLVGGHGPDALLWEPVGGVGPPAATVWTRQAGSVGALAGARSGVIRPCGLPVRPLPCIMQPCCGGSHIVPRMHIASRVQSMYALSGCLRGLDL